MANQVTNIANLEIKSPDDALKLLFEVNRDRDAAERANDAAKADLRGSDEFAAAQQAKARLKSIKEYQAGLLRYIDLYHMDRREQIARHHALDKAFESEPMPTWMRKGVDPDGRGDAPPKSVD